MEDFYSDYKSNLASAVFSFYYSEGMDFILPSLRNIDASGTH